MVQIQGYEMYFINRTNKKGGGVALYIDKSNDSKPVSYMSFAYRQHYGYIL